MTDARRRRSRPSSFRGRHNFTIGGDIRRHQIDILSQQDPRGRFTFTGAATGSDFADFLLGIPATSAIAFGNADKYFRGFSYDAYITDDWRFGPSLTLTAGVRWEYESPLTERRPSGEPRRRAGLHRGAAGAGVGPDRRADGRDVSELADAAGQERHPAAAGDRVAAGPRIVAGRPRRLRHLPQHQRLSVDRHAAGAAAAALDGVQHREHARRIR